MHLQACSGPATGCTASMPACKPAIKVRTPTLHVSSPKLHCFITDFTLGCTAECMFTKRCVASKVRRGRYSSRVRGSRVGLSILMHSGLGSSVPQDTDTVHATHTQTGELGMQVIKHTCMALRCMTFADIHGAALRCEWQV